MILRMALAFLIAWMPGAAMAQHAEPADPLVTAERLSDAELDQQRGGFRWQGVDVNLGAEIRSYLDGALVMQTNVSWQPGSAETSRFVSGALTRADAADLQAGMLSGGAIRMNVGNDQVYLAQGGRTAFVQRDEGGLQNIVLNTASNVAIRQEVDVKVDLANFGPLQAQFGAERMGEALSAVIGSMAVRGY